jgi:hypothetical protein
MRCGFTKQARARSTGEKCGLDPNDPQLKLAHVIPWQQFEQAFAIHYTKAICAPSESIRLIILETAVDRYVEVVTT